ncbi:hypothetical protein PHET_07228 [Paragonimus heterotremus]|uniref:Uncharacterized protein n=1 Tax=Paragonimus heterotremus TaxID=100268 RepID=A0A8J4T7X2_9TREM|nr:hypothetical protein PHET_07228 [Paragonimus heterotremus]
MRASLNVRRKNARHINSDFCLMNRNCLLKLVRGFLRIICL